MGKFTPMMEQYLSIKEDYKDYILFFRLGDFYEMFFEDAQIASKELEITLTGRDCGLDERAPMCGVPYHSADTYIARLIEKGYKVAICEQLEPPTPGKGIVKREVVRVITPGTVLEPGMLDDKRNNYIMTLVDYNNSIGIAYADISTGEFKTTEFKGTNRERELLDEILKIMPREIVISEKYSLSPNLNEFLLKNERIVLTKYYDKSFQYKNAEESILRQFKVNSLLGLGLSENPSIVIATGSLIDYITDTQKGLLIHINHVEIYNYNKYMVLDSFTRRNLELVETIRSKEKKGSLLWVLDKTSTAMGARMLRNWIEEPLLSVEQINERLDAVTILYEDVQLRDELKDFLDKIYDLERLTTKIVYGNVNARDLIALKYSISVLPQIKGKISSFKGMLKTIFDNIDSLEDIHKLLEDSIVEDPPISIKEGGIIKSEFDKELYELRQIINDGKKWILALEDKEKKETGIKTLKIGYNKVFGYYIEITKPYLNLVPETYIRKQTLSNVERYISPELKELETKILGAEDKIVNLEYNIFMKIKDIILQNITRILNTAKAIAMLDVLISFAKVSEAQGYVRPTVNEGNEIRIINGRHPVVECVKKGEPFVPNDTFLDNDDNRFYIITGPNMAGKSTYLRQVALIVLMAQVGCFVPAEEANIGIVDRIFTRVGASDDLFQGQSTFMVEMSELSNILNSATKNSLIILDEIGRGTSTFDGLSIAWAVVEYISNKSILGAKTLFATHYHELTELEGILDGVKNLCISVKEIGKDIVFLRKIVRGGSEKSYGIQVARLAGIPEKVIKRAQEKLKELENKNYTKFDGNENEYEQISIFDYKLNEILNDIINIDIINTTPLEAMGILNDLINKAKKLQGEINEK